MRNRTGRVVHTSYYVGVNDPVSLTHASFEALSLARLAGAPAGNVDANALERLVLRVGRPIPVTLALGDEVGLLCSHLDQLGASAHGVDQSAAAITLAQLRYAAGVFRRADIRDLPFDRASFDAAWTASVLCRLPRDQSLKALQEVHRVLRMGAVLAVNLLTGPGQEWEATAFGPVYACRWTVNDFAAACDALDMQMIENLQVGPGCQALLFRREY